MAPLVLGDADSSSVRQKSPSEQGADAKQLLKQHSVPSKNEHMEEESKDLMTADLDHASTSQTLGHMNCNAKCGLRKLQKE